MTTSPLPTDPHFPRRAVLTTFAAALGAAVVPSWAQQDVYPNKIVKIVVPSAPGGSLDAMARILAQRLGAMWNQSVVVENRPGANFTLGATYVAKSAADGYTLLYAHDGVMVQNPALYPNLPYNPLTELTPVARVVTLPPIMYVRSNLPSATLGEFLQAMRAEPGKFNHAAGGPSATFISELLKFMTKVQYTDVPYKGAALAMTAVAAGECDFTFADPGSAAGLLGTGRIRALAAGSPTRLKQQPDLPTVAEFVPGFDVLSWSGLIAPAKTPPEIIQKINASLRTIAGMPEARKQVEMIGLELEISSSEELDTKIRNDIQKWSRLVKERNIQPR